MSYHIYTTRGLVLSARPIKEADRIYSILTKDFGLIRASGGGVRKEVSKLRGGLEPFSFSAVSLVKGREYWRITGCVFDYNIAQFFKDDQSIIQSFAKVFSLVEKLLAGESFHPEILDKIEEVMEFVKSDSFDYKDREIVEIILVSRVLFELGYLSKESIPDKILEGAPNEDSINVVKKNKKKLFRVINEGILASDLVN